MKYKEPVMICYTVASTLDKWPATAAHAHSRSCARPSSFSPTLIYYIQAKELRRPTGTWIFLVSTPFVSSSCVGEELEMRSTLLG